MKANAKGAALLERMMADKQLRIREARQRHAEANAANGEKPTPAVPAHASAEQAR